MPDHLHLFSLLLNLIKLIIFIHFKDRYLLYWTSGILNPNLYRLESPVLSNWAHKFLGKEFLTFSKDWGYWSAVSVSQPDVDRCKQRR